MTAVLFFNLMEAAGPGPTTEIDVAQPRLLANDLHSTSSQGQSTRPNVTGQPTYSCERWLRLRFPPPAGQVGSFRVWSPGLILPDGWNVYFGSAVTYRTPTTARSDIAVTALPDVNPAGPNVIGNAEVDEYEMLHSPWLVFQAILTGPPADQSEQTLTLEFGWSES